MVFHQQGLAHCTLQDLQKLIHKNLKSSILSYSLHATPTQTGAHRWNVMWGMGGGGGEGGTLYVCVMTELKSLVVLFVEVSFFLKCSFKGMGGFNNVDVKRERIPFL